MKPREPFDVVTFRVAFSLILLIVFVFLCVLYGQALPQPERTIIPGTSDYVCVAYDTEQSKRNLSCSPAGAVREFIVENGKETDVP